MLAFWRTSPHFSCHVSSGTSLQTPRGGCGLLLDAGHTPQAWLAPCVTREASSSLRALLSPGLGGKTLGPRTPNPCGCSALASKGNHNKLLHMEGLQTTECCFWRPEVQSCGVMLSWKASGEDFPCFPVSFWGLPTILGL